MKQFLILIAFATSLSALVARGQSESDWPLELSATDGKIVIYQPQPRSFKDDTISAEAAVSVTLKGKTAPVFGVAWMDATVATDRDTRTARITNVVVTKVRFPDSTPADEKRFSDFVGASLTGMQLPISMDSLRASLEGIVQSDEGAPSLQNDPPKIIFATSPTVLVTLDGPPELSPLEGSKVMRVVNTPFAMVFDPASKSYFLRTGDNWVGAADISGPWQPVDKLPDSVKAAVPSDMAAASGGATSGSVAVLTATEPTELVVTDGDPKYSPLPGNELLYVTNTEADLFLHIDSASYFILLSGRWYNAPTLDGPWSFVAPNDLPQAFANIPSDSPKASVLAHVPGTPEAEDAVIEASIPQTQAIRRDAAVDLKVTYDGDPKFDSMDGTTAQYATNTPDSVIKADGNYYCCKDAVWYQSPQPAGPWTICISVPQPIYRIPPSSPVYNVTYVRVYQTTPDIVYVGYTLGYTGCYPRGGVVVYGTGYRYSAWRGGVYYARPATWGFGVRYNPYSNSWGFGVRVGRFGAWYGPALGWGGSISPYSGWWGPGGYRDNGGYYSGNKVTINQNTYNSWGGNNYTNNVNNSKNTGNINIGNGNGNGNNNGSGNGNRPARPGGGNGNENGPGNGNRPSRPGGEGENSGRPGMGNRPPGAETPTRPRPGERPSQLPVQPGNRLPGRGEQPTLLPGGGGENIYNRPGNRPIQAPSSPGKPSQPIARPAGRPNNVLGDQAGNVFRKDGNDWQQRGKDGWKPAGGSPANNQKAPKQPAAGKPSDFQRVRPQLERDNQARDRGKQEPKREAKPKQQPARQPAAQPKQQPAKQPAVRPQGKPQQQPANAGAGAAAAKRRGQ
jgi:hypothetical protein